MAELTAEDWLATVCPDLLSRGELVYGRWLLMADTRMATAVQGWGSCRSEAQAWLAAHLWQRATMGSPAGLTPTAAQAVGSVTNETASNGRDGSNRSRTYTTLKSPHRGDDELLTTIYGSNYIQLRNLCPAFGSRNIRL